jgi:hypothetical protein
MASAQGTATINFGSTPTDEGSIAVTGQATIGATDHVEAFVMGDDTATGNDADAHRLAVMSFRCDCRSVVAGTGFTIYVNCLMGLVTDQFKIRWVWSG